MAGYSSKQFYNFGVTYEKGKTLARTSEDNPNFIYPRPIQPDVYNPIRGKQLVDTRLQRGFIRGIYPSALGGKTIQSGSKVKQRRLFFQFNPETIDRSVEMNAMIANPLLQDPSQIFQPVAGTAAFSFKLLFNREAEVVSARTAGNNIRNGSWVTDTASPLTSSLDIYGGVVDGKGIDYKRSDIANLGVLADLYVLDSIIGQGITPDLIDFIKDYFTTASNATAEYNSSVGGPSAASFDETGFDTNITKNFGNSAFLSPLPIRIVFSSLFMVEGFVESSSVQFVKFTKDYVPTVCSVNLTLRALYIGFAKEEAYLTSSLKLSVAEARAEKRQEDARIAAAQRYASTGIAFTYTTPSIVKDYADDDKNWVYNNGVPAWNNVRDFWNEGIWPVGDDKTSGGAKISFLPVISGAGEVRSWVSPSFANEIAEGKMSWTLSSTVKFEELNATKQVVKTLFEGPITYYRHSAGGNWDSYIEETAKVAENAVKATTKDKARKNKWGFLIEQTGLPVMDSALNTIRLTISNLITITVNTTGSSVTVPTTVFDSVDFSPTIGVLGNTPANSLLVATGGGLSLDVGTTKSGANMRMGGN